MSKYTTEVRYICETASGLEESKGYNDVNAIVRAAAPKIFSFPFPIWDENYRLPLETKILKHYYTREIGEETVGLWKLRLDTRLNEIMPYYNEMYKTVAMEYDPFLDADYTREGTRQGQQSGSSSNTRSEQNASTDTSTGSGTTESLDAFSDTPQGSVGNLENYTYLTNARKVTGETGTTDSSRHSGSSSSLDSGTTSGDSSEEYFERIKGKFPGKSFTELLMQYRQAIINIDMLIIDELKDLFMNLW